METELRRLIWDVNAGDFAVTGFRVRVGTIRVLVGGRVDHHLCSFAFQRARFRIWGVEVSEGVEVVWETEFRTVVVGCDEVIRIIRFHSGQSCLKIAPDSQLFLRRATGQRPFAIAAVEIGIRNGMCFTVIYMITHSPGIFSLVLCNARCAIWARRHFGKPLPQKQVCLFRDQFLRI